MERLGQADKTAWALWDGCTVGAARPALRGAARTGQAECRDATMFAWTYIAAKKYSFPYCLWRPTVVIFSRL